LRNRWHLTSLIRNIMHNNSLSQHLKTRLKTTFIGTQVIDLLRMSSLKSLQTSIPGLQMQLPPSREPLLPLPTLRRMLFILLFFLQPGTLPLRTWVDTLRWRPQGSIPRSRTLSSPNPIPRLETPPPPPPPPVQVSEVAIVGGLNSYILCLWARCCAIEGVTVDNILLFILLGV
jgi:hypothetical protein